MIETGFTYLRNIIKFQQVRRTIIGRGRAVITLHSNTCNTNKSPPKLLLIIIVHIRVHFINFRYEMQRVGRLPACIR